MNCDYCNKIGEVRLDIKATPTLCDTHFRLAEQNETRTRVKTRVAKSQKLKAVSYLKRKETRYETTKKIESGIIKRGCCSVCQTTKEVQVHHYDYDNPDDIEFLCKTHHQEWHANNK